MAIDRVTSIVDRDRQIAWHKSVGHKIIRYWQDAFDPATWYIEWTGAVVRMWPAEVTRTYSFKVYNEQEERQVKEFLGIEPAGPTLDRYVEVLSEAGIIAWRDYWVNIFTGLKRTDIVEFVKKKADEYLAKPTLKVLPKPDTRLHDEGLTLYFQLDDAIYRKNEAEIKSIMKRMMDVEQSPIVVLGIVLAAPVIVGAVVSAIGSYGFAKFLYEEALQTIDMAVYTASKNKQWDLAEKALAKKKEILDIEPMELFIELLPGINVVGAVLKFTEASRVKYEIDLELVKRMKPTEEPNKYVSIEKAAQELGFGKTPDPYLPAKTTKAAVIPEEIETRISGIVDGDTFIIDWPWQQTSKVRILGVDAPEFKTTEGKAALKFATELLYDKIVTLYIDPKDQLDEYGRILAKITVDGKDAALELLKSGNAIFYPRKENKYVDDKAYQAAQTVVAVPKGFKILIESEPTRAKVYIDNVYVKHLTPSDEKEMKKEIKAMPYLFAPGKHVIKVTKGTAKKYMQAEQEVEFIDGDNGRIFLTLTTPGL